MQTKLPPSIPFTKEGYERIQHEYDQLLNERKDAVVQLQKAREMGDLSENGFYKAAKTKLSSIDHNLHRLRYLIRFGKVKEINADDTIDIGNIVLVDDGTKKRSFTIVGGHESNPLEGKISNFSPIGKALIGKKIGDMVNVQTPGGNITYRILGIS